ncbi:hypothetical protein ADEAN_000995200 [Angomonas deanei]|uniref:RING-type domain-containing protein n=1 Tax=Angomonas deanei TaxID=59799 RepID=A0A7G2CRG3_9TRYP|nr:hypothetical protein ADEAN_000995200 [Angomonas deanei]
MNYFDDTTPAAVISHREGSTDHLTPSVEPTFEGAVSVLIENENTVGMDEKRSEEDANTNHSEDAPAKAVLVHVREPNGEDEEQLCGVCLELPGAGNFVQTLCCGNVLCVNDAQSLGKCPFCRQQPLVWDITQ